MNDNKHTLFILDYLYVNGMYSKLEEIMNAKEDCLLNPEKLYQWFPEIECDCSAKWEYVKETSKENEKRICSSDSEWMNDKNWDEIYGEGEE